MLWEIFVDLLMVSKTHYKQASDFIFPFSFHNYPTFPSHCHTHDNQSHPRLKDLPSRLVPLLLRLLQIAKITRVSLLRSPYVIQHHLASPQPNLEHHKTSPERLQPHATTLTISPARPGLRHSTCLLENSPKSLLLSLRYIWFLSIYVHYCSCLSFTIVLFPVLYLSLYLLCLVI